MKRFGHNFECNVAACSHDPRATNYLALTLHSTQQRHHCVYGTAVTLENRFLSTTQSRTLAFRYRRYGRPPQQQLGFFFTKRRLHLRTSTGIW